MSFQVLFQDIKITSEISHWNILTGRDDRVWFVHIEPSNYWIPTSTWPSVQLPRRNIKSFLKSQPANICTALRGELSENYIAINVLQYYSNFRIKLIKQFHSSNASNMVKLVRKVLKHLCKFLECKSFA